MASALRSTLLGSTQSNSRPYLVLALALGVFVMTFGAYALGLFFVSGGLVWIPFHAAIVGMVAGCWVGYARRGLLFAWVVTYTSLLGFRADHAFFGRPGRGFAEKLAYFVRLDGLVFYAVIGIVLGTLAFSLGFLVRWGINSFRRDTTTLPADGN